jgi:hypothetical protein
MDFKGTEIPVIDHHAFATKREEADESDRFETVGDFSAASEGGLNTSRLTALNFFSQSETTVKLYKKMDFVVVTWEVCSSGDRISSTAQGWKHIKAESN